MYTRQGNSKKIDADIRHQLQKDKAGAQLAIGHC